MGDRRQISSGTHQPRAPIPPSHGAVRHRLPAPFPPIERGTALPPLLPAQERALAASMQRAYGNRATAEMLSEAPAARRARSDETLQPSTPRIRVAAFSPRRSSSVDGDKSLEPSGDDQDQTARSSAFSTTSNGVSITVEGHGLTSTPDFPDGFRWTQTITTNVRRGGALLATPVKFVDPDPNDDTKPFYWTDAEEAASPGVFKDSPSRNPRAGGTVVWDAVLSINGVKGTTVKRFDSLTYGFSVTSAGTVTARTPSSTTAVADHLATLTSSFSGWTFS
jgi:hypothetical protein